MTAKFVSVIATKDGTEPGGRLRKAGEEFEFDVSALPKDEDGKPVKPSWVVPATDANRAEFSATPFSHGKLDDEGRPYPYSVPATPPGMPGASMDVIAKVVNDANADANAEADAEAARVEAAKAKAKAAKEDEV